MQFSQEYLTSQVALHQNEINLAKKQLTQASINMENFLKMQGYTKETLTVEDAEDIDYLIHPDYLNTWIENPYNTYPSSIVVKCSY